jgi:hypothetical protein
MCLAWPQAMSQAKVMAWDRFWPSLGSEKPKPGHQAMALTY